MVSEIPLTRTALVKVSPGQAAITTQPMPALQPGYVLVQTKAVALNPADWTDIDYVGPPDGFNEAVSASQSRYEGCVTGLDYAGIVVQVEPLLDVTAASKSRVFQPGDRICGSSHGCNALHTEYGAFTDYIVVKANLQMHIPDHMSFEAAASLGVGVLSAGMGLFHVGGQGIPPHLLSETTANNNDKKWILVYGGSTATGSIAIQLAKLAGYKVVTTCSPRNFDLARRLGADAIFDYRSPNISSLINTATSNTLRFAFDTVATDPTAEICANSFGPPLKSDSGEADLNSALYVSLLNPQLPQEMPFAVEKRFFLGYSCLGSEYYFEGEIFPASGVDHEFGVDITRLVEILLQKKMLQNHPISVNENEAQKGGFEGVLMGLDKLRKGEGWVARSATSPLIFTTFQPKPFTPTDIEVAVSHCGICGTDLHTLRSGWGQTDYPCVLGHEIIGTVIQMGSTVSHSGNFSLGDRVGIGAQSGACLRADCEACTDGQENYCSRMVGTYNGRYADGSRSCSGYATRWRGPAHFVFKIPDALPSAAAAPLLCGGVTVFSPLRKYGAGPGKSVGIVGIGGLGHLGILLAKAMGCSRVVAISRTGKKRKDALDEKTGLGADAFIATDEEEKWGRVHARTLDLIICTVDGYEMPLGQYLRLLKVGGTFVQVGAPEGPLPQIHAWSLIQKGIQLTGSNVGSPEDIRQMLQLAAEKRVLPWVEQRPMRDVNDALADMHAGKARFRYVLVNDAGSAKL
ncbi:NADP-dependent alcohol dehydrogenase 6 [Talaromyces islandicus]|uniref:alcohol dehydrogenase (NADP(+)) n=1 Tax=Talaromyces islandicus TaxID=28573 RepID=A0A0U1M849_TALIS|nr:NADP-dependent alcohol dehydrogenase 6 [Talaromyces islandicus]